MTRPPHGGRGRHQYSLFYTKTGLDGRLGKKAPSFIVLLSPRFRKLDPLCFYFNGKLSCLTFPEEMSKRHYDSCWIDFENFFTDQQSILFLRQLIIVRSKVERGWVIFYTLYIWCASNGNFYISGLRYICLFICAVRSVIIFENRDQLLKK